VETRVLHGLTANFIGENGAHVRAAEPRAASGVVRGAPGPSERFVGKLDVGKESQSAETVVLASVAICTVTGRMAVRLQSMSASAPRAPDRSATLRPLGSWLQALHEQEQLLAAGCA
jgi:hypothetical protein